MLNIEYMSGQELTFHLGDDLSRITCLGVKEIYVDGDEIGALFRMGDTHCMSGVTVSGPGLPEFAKKIAGRGKL